ncbi:MAG: hypothetical protein C0485_12750 [Pirellula sp.]|nr:hypothetical protein [Pirellula sp.]
MNGLADESLMLAKRIPLAGVFDEIQLKFRDARGGSGIDLNRPRLHEQRSIVRALTLNVPAGDLNLTRVF